MHHGIERRPGEDLAQTRLVAHVDLMEFHLRAGNTLKPRQRQDRTVAQVVGHHHVVATPHQFDKGMCADITGTTTQQDTHRLHYLLRPHLQQFRHDR